MTWCSVSKFGAQGGDWGSTVSDAGARVPESIARHSSHAAGGGIGNAADATEEGAPGSAVEITGRRIDYFNDTAQAGTVAFALSTTRSGRAWIAEKFRVWTDSGTAVSRSLKDQILTNVMFIWDRYDGDRRLVLPRLSDDPRLRGQSGAASGKGHRADRLRVVFPADARC